MWLRRAVPFIWASLVALGLMAYVLYPEYFSLAALDGTTDEHRAVALLVYFLILSIRGLVFVPSTPLLLSGIVLFDPLEVFVVSMLGILTSSTLVHCCARRLGFDAVLEKRYPEQSAQIRAHLLEHQFPVIAGWSICPIVPTDLVVYLASTLRVPLWKCLVGVGAGEAALLSLYILVIKGVLLA
ncbi:TVP38/TMEM64 family protein [Methanofollis formosanus]|uniref:TVP38/TMEM64 family protein n=1 Tax=Methanofollis formosanus TaxID=299308 RepID=A0A8G1EFQ2_9EURY|nr:VTT domain-containing protein [Methanofollis formosanus]QYZ78346.1 TVP38/TMEM64 family protein [Methanofollis formosanus]